MRLKTPPAVELKQTQESSAPVGKPTPIPVGKPTDSTDSKNRAKVGKKPKPTPTALAPPRKYSVESGNLGFNPNTHVKLLARPYTPEAVAVMVEIMRDGDAPPAVRLSAASQLVDRAWGKAKEIVELEAPAEGIRAVLAGVSSSDLSDLLRAVRGQVRQEIDVTPTKIDPPQTQKPPTT